MCQDSFQIKSGLNRTFIWDLIAYSKIGMNKFLLLEEIAGIKNLIKETGNQLD